jgi:hypothetical protein
LYSELSSLILLTITIAFGSLVTNLDSEALAMKSGRSLVFGALLGERRMTRIKMMSAGRRKGRSEFMESTYL